MHLTITVNVGDTEVELDVLYTQDGLWDIDGITIGGLDAYELFYMLPADRREFGEQIQALVDASLEVDYDAWRDARNDARLEGL